MCAPRPRLVDRKKVFFYAEEESLLGLAPALQEGAEAHATAPPLSGAVLAAFLPIATPAPRPRRASRAPDTIVLHGDLTARLPQLRVPQSCCRAAQKLKTSLCLRSPTLQGGSSTSDDV